MFQPSNALRRPGRLPRRSSSRRRRSTWPTSRRSCCGWTRDAPHPDDLNAIFRAVHSIKGSAAMLGCDEIAALTHLQENLLDLLRKDERPIDGGDVEPCSRRATCCALAGAAPPRRSPQAPDAAACEALLRERVAQPAADARGGRSRPGARAASACGSARWRSRSTTPNST